MRDHHRRRHSLGTPAAAAAEVQPRTLLRSTPALGRPRHSLMRRSSSHQNNTAVTPLQNLSTLKAAAPKCLTMMTQDNPFREETTLRTEDDDDPGDHSSEVSSISNDSLRRYANTPRAGAEEPSTAAPDLLLMDSHQILSASPRRPPLPPQEINVPVSEHTPRVVPEWLASSSSLGGSAADSHVRLSDGGASRPKLPRPALVRGSSAPTNPTTFDTAFSPTATPSPAAGASSNGSIPGAAETIFRDATIPAKPNADVLVGNRPRRAHTRGPSLTFSIGSLVGQSSHLTEPTATSTSTYNTIDNTIEHRLLAAQQQAQRHRRAHSCRDVARMPHQSHAAPLPPRGKSIDSDVDKPPRARRRNPVKQEMLYVLGKVAKPVRGLVRSNSVSSPRCELKRSNSGCLT